MVVQSLISVIERVIVAVPEEYLLFLQDAFPYFEKYLVTDYLPKLVEHIAFMMEHHQLNTPRDKALLLDYKTELFVLRKEYANALKKRLKAIQIIVNADTEDVRTITLHSNLYNNLSNTYLHLKMIKEATEAERHLLSAETIISDVMGTDNDYMKTVYRYLHALYTRWKKPELAQKYKGKYLEANKNILKISP